MSRPRARPSVSNEEVDDIIEYLRPLKVSEKDARADVRKVIEALPEKIDATKALPSAAAIRDAGRKIGRRVTHLFETVDSLPAEVRRALPCLMAVEKIQELQGICKMMETAETQDPHTDWPKRHCAAEAYGLMKRISKREPTGSQDGRYRTVSALLFLSVRGSRAGSSADSLPDLKRACDEQLRAAKHVAKHAYLPVRPSERTRELRRR